MQAFSLAALEMSLGDIVVKAEFNENSRSREFLMRVRFIFFVLDHEK